MGEEEKGKVTPHELKLDAAGGIEGSGNHTWAYVMG